MLDKLFCTSYTATMMIEQRNMEDTMKRYMIQIHEGQWVPFMVVNTLELASLIVAHLRKPGRIVLCMH